MKVMIVHKSSKFNCVLCNILDDAGHEYILIEKPEIIFDRVYADNPELIILGSDMPSPGVAEVVHRLKAAPSTRDIPILLIAERRSKKLIKTCYENGIFDYISEPFFPAEIVARIKNISYVNDRVHDLEKLLDRDYLTGLYNRKFFMERFNEEIAWAVRYNEPFSLVIMDIDFFKKINDTYGHCSGDEVLKQAAKRISLAVRTEDIAARYGGEEFILLMPNTNADNAMAVCERIRCAFLNKPFVCQDVDKKIPVTISQGLTTFREGMEPSIDKLISRADDALYKAKEAGRNRTVAVFDNITA
ncbi:MAG: diguanylate cyclase [Dissulfurispiraceae bacterium]|jgi:diguanylate cyclase (GGDEF)-like protein|nr:diguanylate cyclase [Dissulfurispiraceae bacterium]